MSAHFLHAFADGMNAASEVASELGVTLYEIDIHRFPDGEILPTVKAASGVHAVFCSLDRPNEKLIALILVADALKRGGATKIILVAPYLCYMRQDTQFAPGQPISQLAVGALLSRHFDVVITVDAHLHRVADLARVFPCSTSNLSATGSICEWLKSQRFDHQLVVTGPDQESAQWVRPIAESIGRTWSVLTKVREGDRKVTISAGQPDTFNGRPVLLVDDMSSTSTTLVAAAKVLRASGATTIDAIITHALFDDQAANAMATAGLRRVVSTNSVNHPTNQIPLTKALATSLAQAFQATISG